MNRDAFEIWVRDKDFNYLLTRFPKGNPLVGQYIEFPIEFAWAAWCAGEKYIAQAQPEDDPERAGGSAA